MTRKDYVANMEEIRKLYKILVETCAGKRYLLDLDIDGRVAQINFKDTRCLSLDQIKMS